jgi:hypothetical protein
VQIHELLGQIQKILGFFYDNLKLNSFRFITLIFFNCSFIILGFRSISTYIIGFWPLGRKIYNCCLKNCFNYIEKFCGKKFLSSLLNVIILFIWCIIFSTSLVIDIYWHVIYFLKVKSCCALPWGWKAIYL